MTRWSRFIGLLPFEYPAIVGDMPDEMKNTGERHSDPEFHVPLQDCFYKWQIPFIGDLESHKYACNGSCKESSCEHNVPEFFMEIAGNEVYPEEKIT